MKVTLVVVFISTLAQYTLGAGTKAALGEECTDDSKCDDTKGLKCIKPFTDCSKGYCACTYGDDEIDDTSGACVSNLGTVSKGEVCDGELKKCIAAAHLECPSNGDKKCACKDSFEFNADSGVCEKKDKSVKIGETCTATTTCVAKSGMVKACVDTETCSCNSKYKVVGETGCTRRISYLKDNACEKTEKANEDAVGNGMLCNQKVKAYIESKVATPIDTSYECKEKKCVCPSTGKTVYVKLADKVAFCKEVKGKKEFNETCTDHSDCLSSLVCGKCPGDAEKQCHKGENYSAAVIHTGFTLAVVLAFTGVVELMKP